MSAIDQDDEVDAAPGGQHKTRLEFHTPVIGIGAKCHYTVSEPFRSGWQQVWRWQEHCACGAYAYLNHQHEDHLSPNCKSRRVKDSDDGRVAIIRRCYCGVWK